jgi:hypothetical protein
MRTGNNRKSAAGTIVSALGTLALVATFTLAGGATANAATASHPSKAAAANGSCWVDITTDQSLCVAAGVDLVAAVRSEAGVNLSAPTGTRVGGVTMTKAARVASLLTVQASGSQIVSAVYDDINYGGNSFLLSSDGSGCDWGLSTLVPYGWNDRVSSFKSFAGCKTALFKNTNFGGTQSGYSSYKASLGSMNDAASSWATE